MEWLHDHQLLSASRIWRDQEDEPWLVTLTFAAVEGRLECVGLQLRSYLEGEEADQFGPFPAWLEGEFTRLDIVPPLPDLPEFSLTDPSSWPAYYEALEELPLPTPHAARGDQEAVDAVLHDARDGWRPRRTPRPLRTATLRALPLGSLLSGMRRDVAAFWRSGLAAPRTAASVVLEEPLDPAAAPAELGAAEHALQERLREHLEKRRGGHGREEDLQREAAELAQEQRAVEAAAAPAAVVTPKRERHVVLDSAEVRRLRRQAAASIDPGRKAGRPPHYSQEQLEAVATIYRQAYTQGSPSPTRDVAKALGLTRARAAKLVMRCRDPEVGLLGATTMRKAGLGGSPEVQATDVQES